MEDLNQILPTDVLHSIFSNYLPFRTRLRTVEKVCRDWRAISLNARFRCHRLRLFFTGATSKATLLFDDLALSIPFPIDTGHAIRFAPDIDRISAANAQKVLHVDSMVAISTVLSRAGHAVTTIHLGGKDTEADALGLYPWIRGMIYPDLLELIDLMCPALETLSIVYMQFVSGALRRLTDLSGWSALRTLCLHGITFESPIEFDPEIVEFATHFPLGLEHVSFSEIPRSLVICLGRHLLPNSAVRAALGPISRVKLPSRFDRVNAKRARRPVKAGDRAVCGNLDAVSFNWDWRDDANTEGGLTPGSSNDSQSGSDDASDLESTEGACPCARPHGLPDPPRLPFEVCSVEHLTFAPHLFDLQSPFDVRIRCLPLMYSTDSVYLRLNLPSIHPVSEPLTVWRELFGCRSLTSLEMNINGDMVSEFLRGLSATKRKNSDVPPKLESLSLKGRLEMLNNDLISQLSVSLPPSTLTRLVLSHVTAINVTEFAPLAHLSSLTHFSLIRSEHFSSRDLHTLLDAWPRLTFVYLERCIALTTPGVRRLVEHGCRFPNSAAPAPGPRLEMIEVFSCGYVNLKWALEPLLIVTSSTSGGRDVGGRPSTSRVRETEGKEGVGVGRAAELDLGVSPSAGIVPALSSSSSSWLGDAGLTASVPDPEDSGGGKGTSLQRVRIVGNCRGLGSEQASILKANFCARGTFHYQPSVGKYHSMMLSKAHVNPNQTTKPKFGVCGVCLNHSDQV